MPALADRKLTKRQTKLKNQLSAIVYPEKFNLYLRSAKSRGVYEGALDREASRHRAESLRLTYLYCHLHNCFNNEVNVGAVKGRVKAEKV